MQYKNIAREVSYLYKRNGIYYYQRRIPKDLCKYYSTAKIVISLKTKSKKIAALSASHLSLELDSYWSSIRIKKIANNNTKRRFKSVNQVGVGLNDALQHYLQLKGYNRTKLFHQTANRNIGYVVDCLGDRDLSDYSSSDAAKFREYLFNKGLVSSSVKRIFSSVKSIVNLVIKEQGLDINNPFTGTYIPQKDDTKKRKPISIDNIKKIQEACIREDDDIRWAIAIISDTGMRLAEVIGLKREDIVIDTEIPYVNIKTNPKRRLKTKQSERLVPLVGMSLWGARRVLESTGSDYVFERYNKGKISGSNSASAALNKWIKSVTGDEVVIHAFRHALRDRLRAIECPKDIVDQIGGWSRGSVGEEYGSGYPLEVLNKWFEKIVYNGNYENKKLS